MVIDVLVEINLNKKDKTFSYTVPKELEEQIEVGKRVLVPFGKQVLEGFILRINNDNDTKELKDIIKVIDEERVLNNELLELGKKISNDCLCNLVSVYQSMLPKGFKASIKSTVKDKKVGYINIIDKDICVDYLNKTKSIKQKQLLNDLLNQERNNSFLIYNLPNIRIVVCRLCMRQFWSFII